MQLHSLDSIGSRQVGRRQTGDLDPGFPTLFLASWPLGGSDHSLAKDTLENYRGGHSKYFYL